MVPKAVGDTYVWSELANWDDDRAERARKLAYEKVLDQNDRAVFSQVARIDAGDGAVLPLKDVETLTGVNRRTVADVAKRLERMGLMTVEQDPPRPA